MSTYYPNSFFERGRGSIYKSPTKSKPKNANQQAARTMQAAGIGSMGGKTTTTAAQKIQDKFRRETQKDSGSTRDEVPQVLTTGLGSKMVEPNMTMEEVETPNALTKAERIAEALKAASAAVGLSAPTPTQAYVYDPIKVYEAGMQRPVGSLAYDTMFPTQAMLDAVPGGAPQTITRGGRVQPLTVPNFSKFGNNIDNRPFYERLEDPYYSISQGSDVTPDRFNMAGSITAPELAYGNERITPTLPPQATMTQPAAPATAATAAMKEGIDRTLSSILSPDPDVPYVIQAGDTLSDIANKTGTTVEALVEENDIKDKNRIFTGEELSIPSAKSTKTKGDIISSLIEGYERNKDVVTGTQIADSGEIMTDATDVDTSIRPPIRPTPKDGKYFSAESMSDLEILARTIEAEAGGESKKGKLAVGAVIQNRVNKQSWMGKDIKSVILMPTQFSPWNTYTNSAGGEQGKNMLGKSAKPSKASYEAAEKILSGNYVDPTGGATHFVNPKVGTKPKWYGDLKSNGVEKIGQHEFGSPDDPFWQDSAFSGDATSLRPKPRPLGKP